MRGSALDLATALQRLEVRRYSGAEDLKSAFRTQAHRYHPDKNPDQDTSAAFRELIASYQYCLDHLDEVAVHFGVRLSSAVPDPKTTVANFDDIFEDIFGFTRSGRVLGFQEPEVLFLTVKEFALGTEKQQKITAYLPCRDCDATGARPGTVSRICRHCFGHGFYYRRRGLGRERKTCQQCHGRGREMESPCASCDGFGRIKQQRQQNFHVPVGLKPCEIYTLSGTDLSGRGATHIFVETRLKPDPIFKIESYDLLCEYRMDFFTPRTDLNLNFLTPFGQRTGTVSRLAKPGDVITVKHAGLYKNSARTEQGDLKVLLKERRSGFFLNLWQRVFGG